MKRFGFWGICCLMGLLGAALQHYLSSRVSAATLPAWTARRFYLTKNQFPGNQAANACASGYHMASYWEIHDLSSLQYDTTLGIGADDSGLGPPSQITISPTQHGFAYGWIRTGNQSSFQGSVQMPGSPNCASWTSNANALTGTEVSPNVEWFGSGTPNQPAFSTWMYTVTSCGAPQRVWCVQD